MTVAPAAGHSPADVEQIARLRVAIARLARSLRREADVGLPANQQSVLGLVGESDRTLGELAALERVTASSMTRIVNALADQRLVRRRVSKQDGRVVEVAITALGRKRWEESRRHRNAWLEEQMERLDPSQVRRVLDAVASLEALASGPAGSSPPD